MSNNKKSSINFKKSHRELIRAINSLIEALPGTTPLALEDATKKYRSNLVSKIHTSIQGLQNLALILDPVKQPTTSFDPMDPKNVGEFMGEMLSNQIRINFDNIAEFYGSGIYAIYYKGGFEPYAPIRHTETPIYIGKADPKGLDATTPRDQGKALCNRLNGGHGRRSIERAKNLNLADFECRYLVIRSSWQKTVEDYLIWKFKPIWNKDMGICPGFGKHGDDPEKRKHPRSAWDTLHPGRDWATSDNNIKNRLELEGIIDRIKGHYEQNPPQGIAE